MWRPPRLRMRSFIIQSLRKEPLVKPQPAELQIRHNRPDQLQRSPVLGKTIGSSSGHRFFLRRSILLSFVILFIVSIAVIAIFFFLALLSENERLASASTSECHFLEHSESIRTNDRINRDIHLDPRHARPRQCNDSTSELHYQCEHHKSSIDLAISPYVRTIC